MKAAHLRFGDRGERLAADLLKSLGMEILCRNYHATDAEIDIVARDGEVLCFVEVKARKPSERSRPADAVTLKKRYNLSVAARHYLRQLENPPVAYRFDIIEVIMTGRQLIELRHWPDEFTTDEVFRKMKGYRRNEVVIANDN